MKQSKNEKQVLTIVNDTDVKRFMNLAQKYIDLSKKEIEKIIKKLLKLKIIYILPLRNEKDLWYFHTKHIPKEELDEELYCRVYWHGAPVKTKAKEKLEKKLK